MPRGSIIGVVAIALFVLLGAEPVTTSPAVPPVAASPAFQRIEVEAGNQVQRSLRVVSTQAATLLAVESPCRCVTVTTKLPLPIPANTSISLDLTVTGALPGLKTLVLRTTAGTVSVQIQVISAGLGDGLQAWKALAKHAVQDRLGIIVIIHDLHGEVRNCGCSGGSLGGIDHLGALPVALASWAPGVPLRFTVTGDVDGHRNGIETALAEAGWRRDPTVVMSATPSQTIQDPNIIAVIPTVPTSINHRKLITPVLTGGMTAEALLVDADGKIVAHETLPIDGTLPSEPAILARFADRLTTTVQDDQIPSADCAGCHGTAHQTWLASRHAQAWTSLTPADRTDACIGCHSTPLPGTVSRVATAVHCQSCHTSAAAHAAAPATVRTTGTIDCRTCHDARHDPGFDPVKAWSHIRHSR